MEHVSILDLVPAPVSIEVAPGKHIKVKALGLTDIVQLLWDHQESLVAMYDESAGEASADYSRFLLAAPGLCATIIALGADAAGQEASIQKLPGTVQLIALTEIWRMSVPDPKKLVETLKALATEIQRLKKLAGEMAPTDAAGESSSNAI